MHVAANNGVQSDVTANPFCRIALCVSILSLPVIGCNQKSDDPHGKAGAVSTPQTEQTAADLISQLDYHSPDKLVMSEIGKAATAVRHNLDSSAAWGHLGMMLLAHDFLQPAAMCFERAGALDKREPRWPYFESIAVRSLDGDRSVTKLEEAVEIFGSAELAPQLRLVDAYLDRDRLDEAEKILMDILQKEPNNIEANLLHAQLRLLNNEPDGCLESLKRTGITSKPTRQGLLLASEANRRLGKHDLAETLSHRARQLQVVSRTDKILAEVRNMQVGLNRSLKLADALFIQNRAEDSVRLLQGLIINYPESEWAHVLLARGLIRLRRLDEAKVTLDRVIALNPKSFQAHFRMGVLFQVQNKFEEASTWFEKTIEIRPDAAVAHKNLGQCRFALSDLTGAEKHFKRSVAVQPNYLDGHLRLVEFYARTRAIEAAWESLEAAQKLQPENPRVLYAAKLLKQSEMSTGD